MRMLVVGFLALVSSATLGTALAAVPGSMEITCDTDRSQFRLAAKTQSQVTFRLWNLETGGAQCGPDYVVPMSDLVGFRSYTEIFDSLLKRKALRLEAVLGSDANPVQLCSGAETWLDVAVGAATLPCDFSSQVPSGRKRLISVPFAQEGEAQPGEISVRVFNSASFNIIDNSQTPITWDMEEWKTVPSMHSTTTDTSQLKAPVAGKYLVFGSVNWNNVGSSGNRTVALRLNNSRILAAQSMQGGTGNSFGNYQAVSTVAELGVGDFVECVVHQQTGGSLSIEGLAIGAGCGMTKLP